VAESCVVFPKPRLVHRKFNQIQRKLDFYRSSKTLFAINLKFHQPIMITVALMTLLGFLFILIEKNFTWSNKRNEYTHSILGIIVVCLVFLNVSLT
jgi:hypothetical protein